MKTPSALRRGVLVREVLEAVADDEQVHRTLVDDGELADDRARAQGG